MSDSLDYQTPLPDGRNLRIDDLPDGVRISRDSVSRFALWRELVVPVVAIVGLPAAAIYAGWWVWRYWNVAPTMPLVARSLVVPIALVSLVRLVRDASLNAGIVTEVAVTNGTLYWRQQTLWGSKERLWPLSSVRTVKVDPVNRVLKIHRTRGKALGAFSFHPAAEMNAAAARLNQAIDANRTLPSSRTAEVP